jgi:periplasmic protein TonB
MNNIYNILFILLLICHSLCVFCQNTVTQLELFGQPEELPQFQGGDKALYKFIADNLKYPTNWPKDSISGKVYVGFTIDTSGNILHPKILRGLNPTLDTIAIEIIRAMPKWYPARNRNRPVSMQSFLPIKFGEVPKPTKKKKKKN